MALCNWSWLWNVLIGCMPINSTYWPHVGGWTLKAGFSTGTFIYIFILRILLLWTKTRWSRQFWPILLLDVSQWNQHFYIAGVLEPAYFLPFLPLRSCKHSGPTLFPTHMPPQTPGWDLHSTNGPLLLTAGSVFIFFFFSLWSWENHLYMH